MDRSRLGVLVLMSLGCAHSSQPVSAHAHDIVPTASSELPALEAECENGDASSCIRAARGHERLGALRRAVELGAKACFMNDWHGCEIAAPNVDLLPTDPRPFDSVPAKQLTTEARAEHVPVAAYPKPLADRGVEGAVILLVDVRADGSTAQVRVIRKVNPTFDSYAVLALRMSRWKPALVDGRPVDTRVRYTYDFSLR